MNLKKVMALITIVFSMMIIGNIANAYTVTLDDISAEKEEKFTVNMQLDTKTPLANGHIKFDSSKVEFVEANQENMKVSLVADGDLAWIYVDTTSEGITNYEFVFKVIEKGESDMTFEDLAFVDSNGNEYTVNDISINKTSIKINKKSNTLIIAIIAIVVVILILALIMKKNSKSKKK